MNVQISRSRRDPSRHPIEIVERKGAGHPDTLSDGLAEAMSCAYSRYTQDHFGMILRHQFDKTALMCGRCKVSFGGGQMLEPIRVLVNGRASARLGNEAIPVREILIDTVKSFLSERLINIDPEKDLRILYEVRDGLHSTTGGIFGEDAANEASIHYRFHPRTLADLPESKLVESNDTSLGCASGPHTALESLVLQIEQALQARSRASDQHWVGSDIKTMAVRQGRDLSVTIAAPVLSSVTANPREYFDRVAEMRELVAELAATLLPDNRLTHLVINSGDDLEGRKLYMNFTGSSIESGDEGMVGRGNRIGGLIAPLRPWTMEGISGKNPVYHVGKVYSVAAYEIAQRLAHAGTPTSVFLINRMGEPLARPWVAHMEVDPDWDGDSASIVSTVEEVVGDLAAITQGILDQRYRLA